MIDAETIPELISLLARRGIVVSSAGDVVHITVPALSEPLQLTARAASLLSRLLFRHALAAAETLTTPPTTEVPHD